MTSGQGPKGNFVDNGVFLSFQLTERRKEILRSVKEARRLKEEKVRKFKVDQNGKIWITSESAGRASPYWPSRGEGGRSRRQDQEQENKGGDKDYSEVMVSSASPVF